ncbi:MAG: hypothetical protein ACTS4X_00315 [Candidatus Hodgkinia cicadicola]
MNGGWLSCASMIKLNGPHSNEIINECGRGKDASAEGISFRR